MGAIGEIFRLAMCTPGMPHSNTQVSDPYEVDRKSREQIDYTLRDEGYHCEETRMFDGKRERNIRKCTILHTKGSQRKSGTHTYFLLIFRWPIFQCYILASSYSTLFKNNTIIGTNKHCPLTDTSSIY